MILIEKRIPEESNESVDAVVSLLVRHPELSRIHVGPRAQDITLSFIIQGHLGVSAQLRFRRTLAESIRAYHEMERSAEPRISIKTRVASQFAFVTVTRDLRTVTKDEIALIVALLNQTFGAKVMASPLEDAGIDDEFAAGRAFVPSALEALRRGTQKKSLIGLRDDRRVLIYFGDANATVKKCDAD